jgi:type II secretory pathway component PulF
MKRFRYSSLTPEGLSRRGVLEAASLEEVAEAVAGRGEVLVAAEEARASLFARAGRDPGRKELAAFLEDLAALHDAGMPLRRALDLLADGDAPKSTRSFAGLMARRLDAGADLGRAAQLSNQSSVALAAELARAGELSGRLSETLRVGALILEKQAEFFEKMRQALAYPAFLLVLCFVAIIALAVFAGPALAPLLEGASGSARNLAWLIGIGEFSRTYGVWVISSALLFVGASMKVAERDPLRNHVARWRANLPGLHTVLRDLNCGAFARTFGALLSGGAPAVRAMELAASSAPNPHWSDKFRAAAERMRDGGTIGSSLANVPGIPAEIVRLARVGEESGAIGEMSTRAGTILLDRSIKRLNMIAAMIGPSLLVGMGALIAWIMSAFLSGLSTLGDVGL